MRQEIDNGLHPGDHRARRRRATSTTRPPARSSSTTTPTARSRSPARPARRRAPATIPWNDSSAFAAFSRDPSRPYTVIAYLEKAGYGSQAAAPVVKCMFLADVGPRRSSDPVVLSDPLDPNCKTCRRRPMQLTDPTCFNGRFDGGDDRPND